MPEPVSTQTWRGLLAHAVQAPSSHNTQPWLFRIDGDMVELYCDRRRRLAVADPLDRELIISCGACLYNLRVVLAHAGFAAQVERLPDPDNGDLLARVRAVAGYSPTADDRALFDAIAKRRTNRHAFNDTAVPQVIIQQCMAAAQAQGGWFKVVRIGDDRRTLVKLVMHADHLQRNNKAFRKELASWMRGNDPEVEDGLPGYALGLGDVAARVAPLVVRTFDRGDGAAAEDMELIEHSPLLALLGSEKESPEAWLRTGEALEAVALTSTMHGIAMSYLNQAVQEAQTRVDLAALVDEARPVQLVLRMGFGPATSPTPRRPVGDVLL